MIHITSSKMQAHSTPTKASKADIAAMFSRSTISINGKPASLIVGNHKDGHMAFLRNDKRSAQWYYIDDAIMDKLTSK